MKLLRPRRKIACEMNMTPMIDVVFQLIIFFMCSMQLVRLEVEELSLPKAAAAETPPPVAKGPVIVNVHKDGRIVLQQQVVTPEQLGNVLDAAIKQRAGEDKVVIVRGDRQTPWETIRSVLDAAAQKGIANVKVAVLEGQGAGQQ